MRVMVCVVVVLGCSSAHERVTESSETKPSASAMMRARSYELGKPVRDYAAAAKLYALHCRDGAGDLTACKRWLRASLEGRGADQDRRRILALATKLCEHREDGWSCALLMAEPSPRALEILERVMARPCDAAHLDRCELPRDFVMFGGGGSREAADRAFDQAGCTLGVFDACERLRYAEEGARKDAFKRLGVACDQGDAVACEIVDRPIDPVVLCAAHDYQACGIVGCLGDRAAAERALAHDVTIDCGSYPVDETDAKPVVPVSDRLPFDSVEFQQLASTATHSSHYQIYNRGTRDIAVIIGAIYMYDAAGNQISRNGFELQRRLASGHGTTLAVAGERGASFEPCIDVIKFDDDERSRIARCPARKAKGARWGDGRDNVQLQVDLDDIPLADGWTSTLEPALCEPFEQSHVGIRIRAIGGDHVGVMLGSHWTTPEAIAQKVAVLGPALELPFVREPTTIAYRVAGIDDLQLSAPTLARIFQGQIARWNDPAIAAENPRRALPATPIVVVQDAGGSGQLRLTTYLARAARGVWKLGAIRNGDFFAGVQRQRIYELGKTVATTDGAITYLGPALAKAEGLHVARLRNARGAFVAPTTSAITSGEYPLASSRRLYVFTSHPDKPMAKAAHTYATWLLIDGLAIFEKLGYGPEPEAALQAARAKLRAVR